MSIARCSRHRTRFGILGHAAVLLALAGGAAPARANITAPQVLAGPSADLVELGDVALAADGTGGAIWRTVTEAGSHIYVAQYAAGTWSPAQRVDVTLPYNSYAPRLAAAPGGLLVALWAQDYAHRGDQILYRLSASTLKPGARRFEAPWTVDKNIGTGQAALDGVDPDVHLNDAGVGYVAYRTRLSRSIVTGFPGRPGDSYSEFRVARYNRGVWSSVGVANRNTAYTVPAPTGGNGPQVSVDVLGNGVVAFLEPDAAGVERVWGRRIFGARLGLVTKVSPTDIGGRPLNGDVDAFALAGGGLGAAAVVMRQQPGRPSPLRGPRLFVSQLPNGEQTDAQRFLAPKQVPDEHDLYGLPAIVMDAGQHTDVAYASSGAAVKVAVTRDGPGAPVEVASSGASGDPRVGVGPAGAGVVAYPSLRGDAQGVEVLQSVAGGGTIRARLAAPIDGNIADLAVAGSGLGDALVAFLQGAGDATQLVASAVQAAPQPFLVLPPTDWVRPDQAVVDWDRPASGVGGLAFDVSVGGRVVARDLAQPSVQLSADDLEDGPNAIVIEARDASGQSARSKPATVAVDGTPPRPTVVSASRRRITVRVSDPLSGSRAAGAGVDPDSVLVRFGDGATSTGTVPAVHRYRRPGLYTVRVRAADVLGNLATTSIRVRIR